MSNYEQDKHEIEGKVASLEVDFKYYTRKVYTIAKEIKANKDKLEAIKQEEKERQSSVIL